MRSAFLFSIASDLWQRTSMNVLVLAPHPDDEALGCGGALCLHADKGDQITVVFLTSGELGLKDLARDEASRIREGEARAAAKILGLSDLVFLRCRDSQLAEDSARAIAALLPLSEQAALIYSPHAQEWHPDHKATVQIARQLNLSAESRCFEIWTPLKEPTQVVDISAVWDRKLAAVRAHASQMSRWPYERAVAGLNQYRSAMSGKAGYAEAFSKGL